MYRTNPFACHNLSLAPPVIPLASPACHTTRTQDLLQPQTNHLALLSSLPTTLPNPAITPAVLQKRTQRPVVELEHELASGDAKATSRTLHSHNFANPISEEESYEFSYKLL